MFNGIPVEKLTAPVIVAIICLMVFQGLLVPIRFYKEKCAEADRWRLAHETSEKARAESDRQSAELLEVARTTYALIKALFENSEKAKVSGGQNVAS